MLRRNRRTTWAVAAAAGLALAGAGVPVTSSPAEAAPAPSRIAWTACGDDGEAQCGTLRLPVDWDDPDGATFELAVARRTALDPDARVGTLVFGPGGPGDSGVERVVDGIGRFGAEIQRRFDIVSFDPRGVGASAPITCSTDLLQARPSPVMTSPEDFAKAVEYNKRLRADCLENTGPIYGHADTLSTVKDVDAIRKALGEAQLTFHGSSYGTLLGQQYAETYPRRVRAMVLESVVDHSERGARAFLTSQAATAQDSFDEFVKWCNRTAECALHGRDVRAVWRDLRDRAGRGELPGLSEVALVEVAYRAFYGPDWSDLARTIADLAAGAPPAKALARKAEEPGAVAPAAGEPGVGEPGTAKPGVGEPEAAGSGAAGSVPGEPGVGEPGTAKPGTAKPEAAGSGAAGSVAGEPGVAKPGTANDPFTGVFCSDWSLPVWNHWHWTWLMRRVEQVAPDMSYTRPVRAAAACIGSPQPVPNPQHRLDVRGLDTPILLSNAVHDPASGYGWAKGVARQLGRDGVLLTYEGAGHGTYNRSDCMREAIDRYLVELKVPARGTTCPAVPAA